MVTIGQVASYNHPTAVDSTGRYCTSFWALRGFDGPVFTQCSFVMTRGFKVAVGELMNGLNAQPIRGGKGWKHRGTENTEGRQTEGRQAGGRAGRREGRQRGGRQGGGRQREGRRRGGR